MSDVFQEDGGQGGLFRPLTTVLVVLVGVFAFSALLVLSAYAPDLKSGDNGEAHALSRSAVGFAGIVEALRLSGDPVLINRAPLPPGDHAGLLVVTPTPWTDLKAIEALSFDGPVLVVPPKWDTVPDLKHRGWVGKARLIDADEMPKGSLLADCGLTRRPGVRRPTLFAAGAPFVAGARLQAGPVDSPQTLGAPGWTAVLTDGAGRTLLARAPDRPLYLLSDPDLLNTHGIRSLETLTTALVILRTLRAGDGPVMFDVRLNGLGRERGVLRLLLDPPFLGVTICLAAAAVLAGFQAFCRFGPVRRGGRVIPLGKTALVDNTAALIRLAGREHRMGGRYADLTADLAARAVGAPRGLGGEALTAFLDRLGGRRRTDALQSASLAASLSELGFQARTARTPAGLVAAARRLYGWRMAKTGAAPGAET